MGIEAESNPIVPGTQKFHQRPPIELCVAHACPAHSQIRFTIEGYKLSRRCSSAVLVSRT